MKRKAYFLRYDCLIYDILKINKKITMLFSLNKKVFDFMFHSQRILLGINKNTILLYMKFKFTEKSWHTNCSIYRCLDKRKN